MIKGGVFMFMRGILIIGLSLCIGVSQKVYAEEVDLKVEHQFSGKISLGGYKTTGNTETETFDGKLALGYVYQKWSTDLSFKGSQTSDGGTVTSDYYEAILKGEYEFPYHTYGFVQLGYREDFFGGIYSEKSYLYGIGYHAFTGEPDYSFDFEVGYGERISEKVNRIKLDYDPGTHVAIFAQYNFSKKDVLKLSMSGEYGNDDDYIKKEISWVHQLFENLSADLSYEARTLTAPELGNQRTDAKMSVKIGYDF